MSINIFQFLLLLNLYLFYVEMGKILVIGMKEIKLFLNFSTSNKKRREAGIKLFLGLFRLVAIK